MRFEEYLKNIPSIHSWDGGKTWNSGGFSSYHLNEFHKLVNSVGGENAVVLETGAGNSTLAFLYAQPKKMISIVPEKELFERIISYCSTHNINTSKLTCIEERSEMVLPSLAISAMKNNDLIDLALIDGGHGWPTVFVDFCYVYSMLRKGGILIIDDVQLHSIKELGRFLDIQSAHFTKIGDFGKSVAFRKETDDFFLPDWGGQNYIVNMSKSYEKLANPFSFWSKKGQGLKGKLKKLKRALLNA